MNDKNAAAAAPPIRCVFADASGTLLRATTAHPLGVELFPDAGPLLAAFERRELAGGKIKTGIITNWGSRIHKIVRGLMIEGLFDVIVCAEDVRDAKPGREIFQTACAWADVPPGAAFHVGDSLYDDALGAQAAGLQALWIHRRGPSMGVVGDLIEAPWAPSMPEVAAHLVHPVAADLTQALRYLEKIQGVR